MGCADTVKDCGGWSATCYLKEESVRDIYDVQFSIHAKVSSVITKDLPLYVLKEKHMHLNIIFLKNKSLN